MISQEIDMASSLGPVSLSRYKSFDASVPIVHDDVKLMIPYPKRKRLDLGVMTAVFSPTVFLFICYKPVLYIDLYKLYHGGINI